MYLTVNLWSRKEGELKRFLESFYESEVDIFEKKDEWVCDYARPVEAVDIISAVIDNNDKFQLIMCVQLDGGQLYHVTPENHNDIIRDILLLFYNEYEILYN